MFQVLLPGTWENSSRALACFAHLRSPLSVPIEESRAQSQAALWLSAGDSSLCHNYPPWAAASLPPLLPYLNPSKHHENQKACADRKGHNTTENSISPKTKWAPSPHPALWCICSTFPSVLIFCSPWFTTPSTELRQANLNLFTQEKSFSPCRCCQAHYTSDLYLPT